MRIRPVEILAVLLLLVTGCGSFTRDDVVDGAMTIYRSPERARTMLTATQTLRYHAAQEVAKAYVQGRITRDQAVTFQGYDDAFRSAWDKASDLVQLWLVAQGKAPAQLQEAMSKVEELAAQLDAEKRKVE